MLKFYGWGASLDVRLHCQNDQYWQFLSDTNQVMAAVFGNASYPCRSTLQKVK